MPFKVLEGFLILKIMNLNINKNKLTLIIAGILIVLLAGDIIFFKLYRKEVKRKNLWKDNYLTEHQLVKIWELKNGTWVTQAKDYNFRMRDLKGKVEVKDSVISKLNYMLDIQDENLRKLRSILLAKYEAIGEGGAGIKDTVQEEGVGITVAESKIRYALINDGYLSNSLFIFEDTLTYKYHYSEDINVLVTKFRKLTKKDKPAFFLWRWLRPWDEKTTVSGSNPNSRITSAVKVRIEK